jgi:hypothetical protein
MIPADLGDTLPPGAPLGDGLPRRLDADPWRPCKQTCDNQTQSHERVARNEAENPCGPNRGRSRLHAPRSITCLEAGWPGLLDSNYGTSSGRSPSS